jgi:hypothetical protein
MVRLSIVHSVFVEGSGVYMLYLAANVPLDDVAYVVNIKEPEFL